MCGGCHPSNIPTWPRWEGDLTADSSLNVLSCPQICLHDGPACDPDNRDKADTEPVKNLLANFISKHFPGVEPVVSVEESCMYTMLPDENPVIDFVPEAENIIIAVGFSGTGFKLGPVTGNMIADMAMGIKTEQDVEILSLRRFSEDKAKL